MGFIDDQYLGLNSAQDPHREGFKRNQALRGGEWGVKGFKEPCEESPFLWGGGYIHNDDRGFCDPGPMIIARWMQAFEFLDCHGLAHAAIAVEQQTGHSTAGRIVKTPFELIENSLHALVRDPASFLDMANSCHTRFECLLTYVVGEVREIQCHRRGPS